MAKLIAAFNMTLDGISDHDKGIADDDLHRHYTELLNSAGTILYGRTTYQLMADHWPNLVAQPSGNQSNDEFAVAIDRISKIVFSNTLKELNWKTAKLATRTLRDEALHLKQQAGKDVLVGSRSLIVSLLNMGLVDEFQICVQPVLAGNGLPLFDKIEDRIELKLLRTKTFQGSGSVVFYYQPLVK